MKSFLFSMLFFCSLNAFAFKADSFKGVYPILTPASNGKQAYVVIDTNTLSVIWSKYATGPLPNNLADLKNAPAILVAFTDSNILFLTLESSAMVGTNFLHLTGDNSVFELARQPNGQSQAGVEENGSISNYLLGVPSPL